MGSVGSLISKQIIFPMLQDRLEAQGLDYEDYDELLRLVCEHKDHKVINQNSTKNKYTKEPVYVKHNILSKKHKNSVSQKLEYYESQVASTQCRATEELVRRLVHEEQY